MSSKKPPRVTEPDDDTTMTSRPTNSPPMGRLISPSMTSDIAHLAPMAHHPSLYAAAPTTTPQIYYGPYPLGPGPEPFLNAPMSYYRPTSLSPMHDDMPMTIRIPEVAIPMTILAQATSPIVDSTPDPNLNPPTRQTRSRSGAGAKTAKTPNQNGTTTKTTTSRNRKRKLDLTPTTENDDFTLDEYPEPLEWVMYYPSDFERDANAASRAHIPSKKRRVEERPEDAITEPQFLCAGCKKEYFQIADHFRELELNSPCGAQVFHLKVGEGKWGGGISYSVWAATQWAV
ncbi:hypothetical protein FB45DRAFT_1098834 [Roridomyces roridus]|uniref:Uncharacterized protein n=1 Tax=Roridomyces roridus TaxID=1738132 RepID=A0AAD7CEI0_9AGAR|nr:hypothetical protein FB45DRAFT_1098834 [Roridomyces roridus]